MGGINSCVISRPWNGRVTSRDRRQYGFGRPQRQEENIDETQGLSHAEPLLCLYAFAAVAQHDHGRHGQDKNAAMDPAMMEAMMKAGTPGDAHKKLDGMRRHLEHEGHVVDGARARTR